MNWVERNAYRILVVKARREEITKKTMTGLRNVGWGGMDWIDLAQDRDQWMAFVNKVMNL
jgi:hypothetical protein